MRRFLLLISLLLLTAATSLASSVDGCLFPFDEGEAARYTVAITFKNASFSGICVIKRMDGVITGSVVNEFGIRVFDFKMTSGRRRVKLLNVMKPLDKCLIRKTIARDLKPPLMNIFPSTAPMSLCEGQTAATLSQK